MTIGRNVTSKPSMTRSQGGKQKAGLHTLFLRVADLAAWHVGGVLHYIPRFLSLLPFWPEPLLLPVGQCEGSGCCLHQVILPGPHPATHKSSTSVVDRERAVISCRGALATFKSRGARPDSRRGAMSAGPVTLSSCSMTQPPKRRVW
jgi:hypothetical protein